MFHGSTAPAQIVQLDRPVATIYTATFVISVCTTGRRCGGHICAGEALQCVYCKRSHAALTIPEKI